MANSRVQRARETEDLSAEEFRIDGWLEAERIAASLPGKDIQNMPGWSIEVKATRDNKLPAALRQAAKNAEEGETPVVIWRPDGYGPERIDDWIVAFRFKDARALMRVAEGWADAGQPQSDPLDALLVDRLFALEEAVFGEVTDRVG